LPYFADKEGGALNICATGKDRTGVAADVLPTALGGAVADGALETMIDGLISDEGRKRLIDRFRQ
jgi:protein tyrosine/serine phosphatase